jgi:type IV pilus assembly protein PilC
MPNFAYVAKTHAGEEEAGVLSGASVDQVVDELHHRGLIVLHVAEDALLKGRASAWKERLNQPVIGGVGTRDLALFTRQLSTLFEAGIPLVRGLRGLSKDETNRTLSRTVGKVAETVERGNSLADAMAMHPRIFNNLYVSMVRAGEGAGTLDKILQELAIYLEKLDAIKTKVRSAMSYPIFVLVFAIAISLFLLLKIVPTFEQIYADFGTKLPGPTLAVVYVSHLIRDNALVSIAIALGVIILFWLWTRTRSGRYIKDNFLLTAPVFGPIIRKATISRMDRTLGILLQSGLPVLDALELTKGATGNAVLSRALEKVKDQVARGEELTPAFRSTGKMPEMVLQLMATGEESGQVDSMLLKSSEFYDRQVEAAVQGLTSLIEPLLIVLVGVIVGIVVVTMFLPIFYLGQAIMQGGYNYSG